MCRCLMASNSRQWRKSGNDDQPEVTSFRWVAGGINTVTSGKCYSPQIHTQPDIIAGDVHHNGALYDPQKAKGSR